MSRGAPAARRAAIVLALGAMACGGGPKSAEMVAPRPQASCTPGDPSCERRFREQGVTFNVEDAKIQDAFRDIIRLTTPRYETPEGLPTVMVFPHKEHATLRLKRLSAGCPGFPDVSACTSCHHMDLERDAPRKCSECHPREPAPGAPPILEAALHTRCIGCHRAANEKCPDLDLRTATDCAQCHRPPSTKKTVVRIEGPAAAGGVPSPAGSAATAAPAASPVAP